MNASTNVAENEMKTEHDDLLPEGKRLRDRCERILLDAGLEPYDFRASYEPAPRQRLHVGHGETDGVFVLKVNNTAALKAVLRLLETSGPAAPT